MATSTALEPARSVLRIGLSFPSLRWLGCWLGALALASCRSATEAETLVELLRGDRQPAFLGAELGEPLEVRVTRGGEPARGLHVRWRIIEGGGTVHEPLSVTDACRVLLASVAACWGTQDGADGDFQVPRPIGGITDVRLVSVGFAHACALAAFQVWCWGDNGSHQLGVPTPQQTATPVRVVFPP